MIKVPIRKNQFRIQYNCDYCGQTATEKESHYKRTNRHFCSMGCYASYRKEVMPPEEQPTWKGGVTSTEAHRRWKSKNPKRMSHLKARRYAREKGAKGSHTLEEWESLKERHEYNCLFCGKRKPLTKDHIVPLSEGGTDFITNIQPLCRNCNSRKWKHTDFNIHDNPELVVE